MPTVTDLQSYQNFALQQQAENNAWSAQQVQQQMDFQERMSNTAHQREMADLQAAGINPILAAQTSGASVPSGNAASPDTSAAGNVGQILQQVLQADSAREVASMYNSATIMAAQIAASASMYGADMSYQNSRDHPNSWAGIVSRMLKDAQSTVSKVANSNAAKSVYDSLWNRVLGSKRFGSLNSSIQSAIRRRWSSLSPSKRSQLISWMNGKSSASWLYQILGLKG